MSPQSAFAELARTGGRGALVTNLAGGAKMLIHADGRTDGTLGDPVLDEQAATLGDELMWAERFTLITVARATASPRAVQASTSSSTSFMTIPPP